jgi:hypothetical protein
MHNALRLAIVAAFGVSFLVAGTITFTYTGNATGIFNGAPITNDAFALVLTGDMVSTVNGYDIIPVTGVLTLPGLVSATEDGREEFEPELPNQQSANLFAIGDMSGLLSIGPDWNHWNPADPSSIGPEPFFTVGTSTWQTAAGTYVTLDLESVSSSLFGSTQGVLTVTITPEPSVPEPSVPEPSTLFLTAAAAGILGWRFLRREWLISGG